jgi:hypothetical protein
MYLCSFILHKMIHYHSKQELAKIGIWNVPTVHWTDGWDHTSVASVFGMTATQIPAVTLSLLVLFTPMIPDWTGRHLSEVRSGGNWSFRNHGVDNRPAKSCLHAVAELPQKVNSEIIKLETIWPAQNAPNDSGWTRTICVSSQATCCSQKVDRTPPFLWCCEKVDRASIYSDWCKQRIEVGEAYCATSGVVSNESLTWLSIIESMDPLPTGLGTGE